MNELIPLLELAAEVLRKNREAGGNPTKWVMHPSYSKDTELLGLPIEYDPQCPPDKLFLI